MLGQDWQMKAKSFGVVSLAVDYVRQVLKCLRLLGSLGALGRYAVANKKK